MTSAELYKVLGVRSDNSRVIFCQGAIKSQAERAQEALLRANIFVCVEIKPDREASQNRPAIPNAVVWT
jgi:hypothetical protein